MTPKISVNRIFSDCLQLKSVDMPIQQMIIVDKDKYNDVKKILKNNPEVFKDMKEAIKSSGIFFYTALIKDEKKIHSLLENKIVFKKDIKDISMI